MLKLFQLKEVKIPEIGKVKHGEIVVNMKNICKRFPPNVVALDHVDFTIRAGEVHALLGENGAGKTTLMNILYGLYKPDKGEIYVYGRKVHIRSPKDAIKLGIEKVHQNYMLVDELTVAENIFLGLKSPHEPLLDIDEISEIVAEFAKKVGFPIDPKAKVWQLSAGEKQRVEILKALFRGARILILDEPTSVLTPIEAKQLFKSLKRLAEKGLAIVFVTHKLPEVFAVSDRITVLRKGKVVGVLKTKEANEKMLAELIVGRSTDVYITPTITPRARTIKSISEREEPILEVKGLCALNDRGLPALKDVSFTMYRGEILSIVGIAGNGERELAEVLVGLRKATKGKVLFRGHDITNKSVEEISNLGIAYIPEDRLNMGIVPDLSVQLNLILTTHSNPPFAYNWFLPLKKNIFLNIDEIKKFTERAIAEYEIKVPHINAPAKHLSGGNIQRLILARELLKKPYLLIAHHPTRGLDIAATNFVHKKLLELRSSGVTILLITEDLDEALAISDRIAVIYEGEIMGIVPNINVDLEEISLLMMGAKKIKRK